MAMKTIISKRTIHAPGPNYKPAKISATGAHVEAGDYQVTAHKPGTPVTMDEKEADALLAAHPEQFELAPEPAKTASK